MLNATTQANTAQTMTLEERFEAMERENANLRAKIAQSTGTKGSSGATIKIGEKGGVCLYGLGRFPVALYLSQWEKLIAAIPEVQKFIDDNRQFLSVKENKNA